MDYPYMPEKIREQGREAIEAELEKRERIRGYRQNPRNPRAFE